MCCTLDGRSECTADAWNTFLFFFSPSLCSNKSFPRFTRHADFCCAAEEAEAHLSLSLKITPVKKWELEKHACMSDEDNSGSEALIYWQGCVAALKLFCVDSVIFVNKKKRKTQANLLQPCLAAEQQIILSAVVMFSVTGLMFHREIMGQHLESQFIHILYFLLLPEMKLYPSLIICCEA